MIVPHLRLRPVPVLGSSRAGEALLPRAQRPGIRTGHMSYRGQPPSVALGRVRAGFCLNVARGFIPG